MEKTNTITVSRATAEKYKKLLAIDDISVLEDEELEELGIVKDTTLFCEGIEFKDKKYAELKVCAGSQNLWAEMVWFKKTGERNGVPVYEEACCSDAVFDGIEGLWECALGKKYNVNVVIED